MSLKILKSIFFFLVCFIFSCSDSTHRIQWDNSNKDLKNSAASTDGTRESSDTEKQSDIEIEIKFKPIDTDLYEKPAPMKEFLCQEIIEEKNVKQSTSNLYLRIKINNGSLECTLMNLESVNADKILSKHLISLGTRACQFLTYENQDSNEYYVETLKNPEELRLVIISNPEKNGFKGKGRLLYEYKTGPVASEFKNHQFSCLIPDEKVKSSVLWTKEFK
ncbi:MAG: hypothetical protein QE271_14745 [Bacteriovoracaceae bacterium]|nr:hypothetical protein [Bacteriovoracaceae bacterium]